MSKRGHSAVSTVDSEYVQIETVADTLGIPVSLIKRRVEVGDVPSHKIRENGTVVYYVRWDDLGISAPTSSDASQAAGKVNLEDFVEEDPWGGLSGTTSCFEETGIATEVFPESGTETATGIPVAEEDPWVNDTSAPTAPDSDTPEEATFTASEGASVMPAAGDAESEPEGGETQETPTVQLTGVSQSTAVESHVVQLPSDTLSSQLPAESPAGFRQEVSAMHLDAREIVSGLLDRWEHTLEQRIYAENRQRFETELLARQSTVKNLQMEIQTSRAQHAADLAQKDRLIAERERHIAECEREIRDLRSQLSKKRRWPFTS